MAPQAAHQPAGLAQASAFLVEAAGQDAILDIVDLIAQIVDQRLEAVGQMIQQMGEQSDRRADRGTGQHLAAETIDRLQRMAPAADHETRIGHEADDPDAFGVEVEIMMQVGQHADDAGTQTLQADARIRLQQKPRRRLRQEPAVVEPVAGPDVGEVEMEARPAPRGGTRPGAPTPASRSAPPARRDGRRSRRSVHDHPEARCGWRPSLGLSQRKGTGGKDRPLRPGPIRGGGTARRGPRPARSRPAR